MVKSPVPETDKGPLRRSRRTESVPLLSTPSSSTATKRSRKKKSWLKEQFLPLTPPTLLGCRGDVDRIKDNRRIARALRMGRLINKRVATTRKC
ncbi:unnamed protein product [Brassica napus]|uniref:(rape) hypothetical protein n=1 Tax=Brassica napus TaxID=3708 RepID=A0A816TS68_BRANA|nr:unnamed protein product [Brassica napus]